MERSIEVEKLKAEIKLMKVVNNNLSAELRTDEDINAETKLILSIGKSPEEQSIK